MDQADLLAELVREGAPFETVETARGREFVRGPRTVADLLALADEHPPDRPFLCEGARVLRYGELAREVRRRIALLDALGVGRGERVAIYAANSIEWALLAWATASSGRVVAGVNGWWRREEALAALADCAPAVLAGDRRRLERIMRDADELGGIDVLQLDEAPLLPGARRLADVVPTTLGAPARDLAPDDPLAILYTSGTSGDAKGVVCTHRGATATVQNVGWLGAYLQTVRLGELEASADEVGTTLLTAPMFHVAGLQWGIILPVAFGGSVVIYDGRFDPSHALELIQRHRITSLGGVPTTLQRIVDHPAIVDFDVSSVTSVSWGGAPAPPDLPQRVLRAFPSCAMVATGYGMTENGGLAVYVGGTDFLARPRAAGRPFPSVEVRVVDAGGTPLAAGCEGVVELRGAVVTPGYWNRPEATADAVSADGWLTTGDLGSVDADGFLSITGRAKDMVIRGGENVYPVEIEAVLELHPGVAEAAVVGRPDADLGERVHAVVRPRAGASPSVEELRAHVAAHLAPFKVPDTIDVIAEPLPRNAAGKLLKDVLRGEALRFTETL